MFQHKSIFLKWENKFTFRKIKKLNYLQAILNLSQFIPPKAKQIQFLLLFFTSLIF